MPLVVKRIFFGAGNGLDQRLGQQHGLVVAREEGAALLDRLDDRLYHMGMSVAQDHRAGAHEPVDVLISANVPDLGAPAASDQEVLLRREGNVAVASWQKARCLFQ